MRSTSQKIRVYTTPRCPRCMQLKKWLHARGISFQELDMSDTEAAADLIMNDVFVMSSPILRIKEKFLVADEIFEGGRLNEKILFGNLKDEGSD